MSNPFGLYIIVESDLSNHSLDRAITHTEKTQPRDVLVMSGGQYDRAMQTCERIRMVAPLTRITYRKYPNDGAIALFGHNGASIYAAHVKSLVPWLKQYRIAFHLDNESVRDDMRPYAKATADAIRLADEDGVALAVASFATGNPAERHYAQMDELWRALAKTALSFWAPHEYIDTTPQASGGHVYRFKEGWNRCKELGIRPPRTCIQEYGLLVKHDPEAGWRRTSMSGKTYADELVSYYQSWYKPDGVSVCVYAYCGMGRNSKWRDCSVDDDSFLKVIEGYVPPVAIDPTPTVVLPPIVTPPQKPPEPAETPPPAENSVDPPSLPIEMQPAEASAPTMTLVPTALLKQWREDYGTRANELRDAIRGLTQKAIVYEGYVSEIDKLLEKLAA